MRRRMEPWFVVLLVLIALGLGYMLVRNPERMLIPVVVLGAIFLLYKFPPSGFRKRDHRKYAAAARKTRPPARPAKARERKPIPFKVIEGGKDDDDLPKYH
ncbi:hypothetical protein IJ21_30300 [Paenibacillus sp. 32O-W]|uniref:hypothetical protein n=1 Tax=Paenibacillus sp. 32O-W TaxID=1695218 RepID=UPI0007218C2A|nr:hypothetical protein [Paenibacillus sp. 32O-W]ALS28426.1 hypothetical protein IJ21_30300 [Paenibacillus sp. 32O-W]